MAMNNEPPKPPDGYATWLDWAIADSPLSGTPHAALACARAELAALRAEVERVRTALATARDAALEEAAKVCKEFGDAAMLARFVCHDERDRERLVLNAEVADEIEGGNT